MEVKLADVTTCVFDDVTPVLDALLPKSHALYITFAALQLGNEIPVYEFVRPLQDIHQSKMFIRDFARNWYLAGLRGISGDARGTAEFLRQRIDDIDHEQTVLVGSSMGGFAAILMASLLQRGRVIAICPQTFVTPLRRLWNRDRRWQPAMRNMYAHCQHAREFFDLKPLVAQAPDVQIDLYVPNDNRLDNVHARHLSALPNVQIHVCDGGGHYLARKMRDTGQLQEVLRNV